MDMMQSLSAQEKQEAISVALSLMQSCRSVMGEQVQNQIRTVCFSNSGVDTVSALQSCSLIPTSCRVALSRVPPQFIQRATSTTVQTQTNAVQVAAPQPAQTADAPAWWPDWAGPYTNNFATSSYAETIPAIPAYIAPRYTSHTAPSSSYVVPSHTTSATPAYSAPSYTAPMYTAPAASSYPAPSYTASASPAYTATSYTSPMYTAPVPASPAWWPDWAGPYTGSPSTFGSPSLSHSYTPAASYTPIVSYMPVEFMESNTPSFF